MVNVPKLHEMIENRIATIGSSYFSFYRDVITGRISHHEL